MAKPAIIAISTLVEDTEGRFRAAQALGYITFIYDHADPERRLKQDKFMYIHSDDELREKIAFIQADPTVADEVRCL